MDTRSNYSCNSGICDYSKNGTDTLKKKSTLHLANLCNCKRNKKEKYKYKQVGYEAYMSKIVELHLVYQDYVILL